MSDLKRRRISFGRLKVCFAACACVLVVLHAAAQEAQTNIREFLGLGPPPDVAAAKLGEPLYRDNCATCHGPNARGAQGPNLVRSPLVLHDEKGEEIGAVVKTGRPASGMPAFPDLSSGQVYDIAEFIHSQVELAANRGSYRQTYANLRNQVSGDAAKGKDFFASNCVKCHSVSGDLAGIGTKYPQPSLMLTKIAWPAMQSAAQGTVTTASGQRFSGAIEKIDDFDVILQETDGTRHSWPRNQVRADIPDKLAGHRALLAKYTDSDLHNLTAYLETIK